MRSSTTGPNIFQRFGQQQVKQIATGEDWLKRIILIVATLWLLVVVVFPLFPMIGRSFLDRDDNWIGLSNYIRFFTTPALEVSFFNSFYIAITSSAIAIVLAFIFAYALTRTAMVGKQVLQTLGMLPLYIPPLAHAIALIYLFGNKGVVTTGFFDLFPGWDIELYGANGIIIGEVLYVFPQALVILTTALSLTDARLYEAAQAMRTPPWRTFLTVTLPSVKYGLMSAIFVCFTLAFTDFGVPKVVGGDFNVLATDIYKQVIGQQNFSMGATISVFLLIPTVIAFIADRIIQGEKPLETIQREIAEETGYQAYKWQHIGKFALAPSYSDEYINVFIARDLEKLEDPPVQDEDEDIEVIQISREELEQAIYDGEAINAEAIASYFLARPFLEKKS